MANGFLLSHNDSGRGNSAATGWSLVADGDIEHEPIRSLTMRFDRANHRKWGGKSSTVYSLFSARVHSDELKHDCGLSATGLDNFQSLFRCSQFTSV